MNARRATLLALFFASGFTGLVYEVLWLRALALVFGNTAYAASATLAVFFLGMGAGQAVFGRRAQRLTAPIRVYALLELGVAVSASAYFVLLPAYAGLSPRLFAAFGDQPLALGATKILLSALPLFPPAFCMGATLPVLGQYLIRNAAELAPTFSVLYGANTLGGAAGALAASFVLPGSFGYRGTCLFAIACSAAISFVAYRIESDGVSSPTTAEPRQGRAGAAVLALAFVSGLATLALEVLWTRMFAQVLQNSVYSFAVILVTFLAALALGAALAGWLAQRPRPGFRTVLLALLLACGAAVGTTPWMFDFWTGGMRVFGRGAAWSEYVAGIFVAAAVVLLPPGVLIGTVFPYLLRSRAARRASPGEAIGALASANTIGSVAGSLGAGFVLLPVLGMWRSIEAMAILYLLVALIVANAGRGLALARRGAPTAAAALVVAMIVAARPPAGDSDRGELVAQRESAFGTVSVVDRGPVRSLRLDGHYSVGANGAIPNDWRQADLPLFLHPEPASVFFLGMGTGITAGAALLHPSVERVVTAELVPDIVGAARDHFSPWVGGLFTDPRSQVVIADARNYLASTSERFDVIIGDLFVPWHAGTGSLYTVEHFRSVLGHLTERGVFAQWLPLYQLSAAELGIIARTMLEVFPQVTLWRGDFSPESPIVALIGQASPIPIDLGVVVANVRRRLGRDDFPEERAKALTLLFYAGNPGQAHKLFDQMALNTDDRPAIELTAPVSQRRVESGDAAWLTSAELVKFYDRLTAAVPIGDDTFFLGARQTERDYARAGFDLYSARVYAALGKDDEANRELAEFRRRVPEEVARMYGAAAP